MIAGAYDWTDDMLKIKSMQKKFRDSFNGTEINPARWEIAATGGGITHTVADGAVTISTGTTLDDELTLTSRTTFTIPLRVMVAVNMSQRIVGQSVWLELVSIDPTTAQPDGRSAAAWRLDGASPTLANYEVGSEGAPRLGSASGSTIPTTAPAGWSVLELEPTNDECYFHGRQLDTTAARSNSYVRQQQLTTTAPPEPTRAAPIPPDLDAIRAEADRAAVERIAAYEPVLAAARGLVTPDMLDAMREAAIRDRISPEVLRGRLWDAFAQSAPRPSLPARPETGPGQDDPASLLDAMAEALAARSMPGYQVPSTGTGAGRHVEFMGWRPSDMMGELLRARGERNIPRNPTIVAERAFHTTSDFPALLSAAANKMLLAAYAPAAPTYRQIFLRRDFRDFKPHRHLRVGDFPTLLPLMENGEIQAGTMSESQEIILLQTFARRIRVTRPMLVNDDLGAFTDFAAAIGRRVADFENATAYGLLNSANGDGPTLSTGNAAVFGTAAARANKASAGTALDLGGLAAGRAAVMRQRTLDGLPIAVGAQMRLLVGPNLELPARQLTVPVAANQISQENVYASFVQPVVEPLIPANRWYLFAEPTAAPVYVYGYLNGAEGPQVTTGNVQGVDGVEVSVIFDFGVGAIDWRGGYFNAGT